MLIFENILCTSTLKIIQKNLFFSARHHKKIFSAETFFRAYKAYVTSSGWIPAAFSFKFAILWTCWDVTHYPSRLQHQTNANTNLGTLENSKSKFDLIYQINR